MMRLVYLLVFGLLYLLSFLPLRALYVISDGFYCMVYFLVGYRRRLVRRHLADCFPEKDEAERRKIERGFYHWFCDDLVETIKLFSMRERQIRRRMVFEGHEAINADFSKGQSVGLYLGHYCNWEWITSLPLWTSPEGKCAQIYHPLENVWFDRLFLRLRERFGAKCIPMAETLRRLVGYRKEGQPIVLGYISDQIPFWNNIHHWLDFLHHDTPVLTGAERLMRQLGESVYFADISRPRRGYYVCRFVKMADNASKTVEKGTTNQWPLTDRYFQMLEECIRRQPECYLWTHNRWKRTHEEYNIRLDKETGRVDLGDLEEIKRRKGLI